MSSKKAVEFLLLYKRAIQTFFVLSQKNNLLYIITTQHLNSFLIKFETTLMLY